MNKIHVIDNVISKEAQEEIKNLLYSNSFPWFYVSDITYGEDETNEKRCGFGHYLVLDKQVNSPYLNTILPIVYNVRDKLKYKKNKIAEIYKCRAFLQIPLIKEKAVFDDPHIDQKDPHTVILYYVNDNEARTRIYKNQFNKNIHKKQIIPKTKNLIEYKTITPKQGRAVVFNGKYFHTEEQPIKSNKCILNFNIS